MALTEKLQKPKKIFCELVILQDFGTWGQKSRLTAPLWQEVQRHPVLLPVELLAVLDAVWSEELYWLLVGFKTRYLALF